MIKIFYNKRLCGGSPEIVYHCECNHISIATITHEAGDWFNGSVEDVDDGGIITEMAPNGGTHNWRSTLLVIGYHDD